MTRTRPGSRITGSLPTPDMDPQHIGVAAPHRAAMHDLSPAPEQIVASPYLDHVRSVRKIIETLLVARDVELAKTTAAEQRARVERDLTFLRAELARIHDRQAERAAGCNPTRVAGK